MMMRTDGWQNYGGSVSFKSILCIYTLTVSSPVNGFSLELYCKV